MIDVHVHLAALPTAKNGCRISKKMMASPLLKFVAWKQGLPLDDPEKANRLYIERLDAELAASKTVSRAVLLAMDGAYDSSGNLSEGHSDFFIANDYLLQTVAQFPRFLAGVSINPARKDALDELERCAAKGAVLVKVLPNAQVFDPAQARFRPFYRAMARLGMVLLSHVGYEFSLIGQDQSVGDPIRLIPALEEGVTVVAAHGCSQGLFFYEKHFETMLDLIRRFPKFHVDSSALTLPNRAGMLLKIRRRPEIFERLIFGTDYPLPCFSFPSLLVGAFASYLSARRTECRFDRHAEVLRGLGIPLGKDLATLLRKSP